MHKHHASKPSTRPLEDHESTHTNLLTKKNNSLQIFVDFPNISLLIINSWYTHYFEYARHGLFIGSLSDQKHMNLTNGVKLMHFETSFYSYLLIKDLISKSVSTAVFNSRGKIIRKGFISCDTIPLKYLIAIMQNLKT